ncbi:MAG: anthranilate phosphoribosyltransferase [Candidatus Aquicultor secundus]|uniref:Anthranilate phosphoribosyltransferase n=1 Tax=Candidatus Aquicultor secundus TaxID=1973895 RepID=A0A2M7T5Z1_9ACTN|nr:anthranilate phosphoribosyltransferase [Candidatus Aquicultor secundus]NCO65696.1 anthranilate phosphoribosyltransferase [Solirubrobacter sp.]OIO85555.1 MAG: anthranilate phosphoribosyltransferase [Candidatus Aquicultor secundus]PIU27280.1 MAG: anthranilate phosphoribosyltransferase [Candidatus Aquicultor secundus]PIW21469.1 MAG: anthranilate phosphoribosyltransferase [Candidatus Aquicultor secundus]PIX52517.1 MAG: anthranilate phosphoribosyltransferase [Candidatus Aquicultor secundus]
MLVEAIKKVIDNKDLTRDEAERVMDVIMNGEATQAQIASLITALRMKGETVDEISGFAKVMRDKASRIKPDVVDIVDTCGTGGDQQHTFNISTTVAFVVAGAGVPVAKHGNRSVSSKSGSADVLEALGVRIDMAPDEVERCIEEIGIGFMFAPNFHGSMKHAMGPRREIGVRTVFNILGPLTNPAGATAQVLGVYDRELTEVMARVLGNLGIKHALVVYGHDGLDELSTTGESVISEFKDGGVETYEITPEECGVKRATIEDLRGGTAEDNAELTLQVLKGAKCPKRDIVLMNAAAGLIAADKASSFKEGMRMAKESIDSGRALAKLQALREFGVKPSVGELK